MVKKHIKPGLENITKLFVIFSGNPQEKLKMIHIGGTNGKGLYQQYVGFGFTKNKRIQSWFIIPHLIDFTEN